ncbi:putative transcriptional regulator [Pseudoalteromonas luteoviolacea B = ATCC 29581]|nr:putative transcriptional regulator [Pseudoalteromonas luteoviolacea B = ATCC 29581]
MTISISYVYFASVVGFLNRHGISLAQLELHLEESLPSDPEQRVSLMVYENVLAAARRLLSEPLIGFRLGQAISPSDYGLLGYLVGASKNLAQAIEGLLKFDALVANLGKAKFESNDSEATISWLTEPSLSRDALLRNMTAWVAMARQLVGENIAPTLLELNCDISKVEHNILESWFGCEIKRSLTNRMTFDPNLLDKPIISRDPTLFFTFATLSEKAMNVLCPNQSAALTVKSLLSQSPSLLHVCQTTIAEEFGISPRQLQRRLKSEGTSFLKLLDEERKMRATLLLGTVSMRELAFALGFQEQSSLNKAFQKWFNLSPSAMFAKKR